MKLQTIFGILLFVIAMPAMAVDLIRYHNEDGVLVIAHTIPTHLVHNGYTRLSETGRVIEVVPSAKEKLEMTQEAERLAREQEVRDARKRADEELMRLYSSPRDVEDTRDRKVAEIERQVGRLKAQLDADRIQKRRLEREAARRERAGQKTSAELLQSLETVSARMAEAYREIDMRREEQVAVREQLGRDLERIKILHGLYDEQSQVAAAAGK
jgi:septal ring factor EnvC (AmiA/AmiB activator)